MIVPTLVGEPIIQQPAWNQFRDSAFWQILDMPAGSRRWLAYINPMNQVGTNLITNRPDDYYPYESGVKFASIYSTVPRNYWIDTDREWSRIKKDSYDSGNIAGGALNYQPFFQAGGVYISGGSSTPVIPVQSNVYGVFCDRVIVPQPSEGGYAQYSHQNDTFYKFFPRLWTDKGHDPQKGLIIKAKMVMTVKNWNVVNYSVTLLLPVITIDIFEEIEFTEDDNSRTHSEGFVTIPKTYEVGYKTISIIDAGNYSYQTTEYTQWEVATLTLPS